MLQDLNLIRAALLGYNILPITDGESEDQGRTQLEAKLGGGRFRAASHFWPNNNNKIYFWKQ